MAFDGLLVASLVQELDSALTGGRIQKIAQPERDALLLTIKNNSTQYRLLLSASASLPLLYLTQDNRPSPTVAPTFCMLLRKHLGNARILSVTQPGLERIVRFEVEHLNEMGDLCRNYLIIELMGKHSNLILCDENNKILDSIKHISGLVSSVREVLPGRDYFIPAQEDRLDPYTLTEEQFFSHIAVKPLSCCKAIYQSLTGFSPCMANHVCHLASIDADAPMASLTEGEVLHLYRNLERLLEDLRDGRFSPTVYYNGKEPVEFAAMSLSHYPDMTAVPYESVSQLLEDYYGAKEKITRIRQKSTDLRRILSTALDRNRKKAELQEKQLKDTEKRDKYKVYGELITTYGYQTEQGSKALTCINYYDNQEITIPLDPEIPVMENAKKYFDRYSKLKRTAEAVTSQLADTREEISHLESISNGLEIATREEDLAQIKKELTDYGYIRHKGPLNQKGQKKSKTSSHPFHYLSQDGFHLYVGKNNYQNEELTFELATGNDWWFHVKGAAGSHVILKAEGKRPQGEGEAPSPDTIPDCAFEDAARLAAYYSSARTDARMDKIEVDYIEKKHVKKPGGGKPGFVVYYTNYSMVIDTDISGLTLLED